MGYLRPQSRRPPGGLITTSSVGYYRSCSIRAVWHRRASTYRRTSRTANVVACRNSLGERCRYLTPTAAPPPPNPDR